MKKTAKPYFTHASKSMGGKPEKFGLPSNEQIAKSVYSRVSTRSTTIGSLDALSSRLASRKKSKK